ncbi:MAG: hypothetical protein V4719_06550 [Planctomycetota bacterium]
MPKVSDSNCSCREIGQQFLPDASGLANIMFALAPQTDVFNKGSVADPCHQA